MTTIINGTMEATSGINVASGTNVTFGGDGTSNIGTSSNPAGNVYTTTVYYTNLSSNSDLKLKEKIEDINLGIDFIKDLHPVQFFYKSKQEKKHYGLIAQELKNVLDKYSIESNELIDYDEKTNIYSINYTELLSPLIKSIQELDTKLEKSNKKIKELENKISNKDNKIKKTINTNKKKTAKKKKNCKKKYCKKM